VPPADILFFERSSRMPESEPIDSATSWEYTLSIPNDPRAVTICRRTLRLILTMHGLIGLVDTA
jgi:hypothetical protein